MSTDEELLDQKLKEQLETIEKTLQAGFEQHKKIIGELLTSNLNKLVEQLIKQNQDAQKAKELENQSK